MKIERIVTLANARDRLSLLAMERSLRSTGCGLPLLVIPFDEDRFELPEGATWWRMPEVADALAAVSAHPMTRKYQCLTLGAYQYVDTDVCFLRNPEEALAPFVGFVASCTQWRGTAHTCTGESIRFMAARTKVWQQSLFNAGQFACDRPLFTAERLLRMALEPAFAPTCLRFPHHDQPGLNLLVFASGVEVTNLTLQPTRMESSWAGDYPGDFESYWSDPTRRPYLIHWAGALPDGRRPIDELFLRHLTLAERDDFIRSARARWRQAPALARRLAEVPGRVRRAVAAGYAQWRSG